MKHLYAAALLLAAVPLVAAPPATRPIPTINAKDAFPTACVGCHTTKPDGTDVRLSTLLGQWNGKVDAKRLAAMQAFVPKAIALKGKHPPVTAGKKDIPASCMKCHSATSKAIPPFAPLMHGIHLAKGDLSDFVTKFGGECTHCHKLNKTNGTWTLPGGAEK